MGQVGRPSLYSDELAAVICDRIAGGESLVQICKDEGMPTRQAVYLWQDSKPDFLTECARARVRGADAMAARVQATVDDVKGGALEANAGRVVLSGLQWLAAKMAPKVYGDKLDLEHSGKVGVTVTVVKFADLSVGK